MTAKSKNEEQILGIRLLKKSQKGIFTMIFSRMGLILLLLLINIGLLFSVFSWFSEFLPHFFGGNALFTVCLVIYLINSQTEPAGKITWLILIMLLPVFGSLFYLYTRTEIGYRTLKKRIQKIHRVSQKSPLKSHTEYELELIDGGALSMTRYVSSITDIPVYNNTEVKYFPCGEEMLEIMLSELKGATQSIYMEYFIIEEGIMWGQILEILLQKVAEGIDVRLIYDGTCEFALLPKGYPKKLKALGISCHVFAPATPFVSTHYNYRDHRKILTVDGKVAFTGGINLADEYINAKEKFGYWKDTAVMLKGDAARGFERMFLQMWNLEEKNPLFTEDRGFYEAPADSSGFVMPYYEDPLDKEHVGRQVYIDILARAKRYVYIMTPYLILDGEFESALKYASKRGIEVILLLPGIPDKKLPFALAKSHYSTLIESGVKIYEYTPGFVHAKVFLADDTEAVVGTVNLDYRSLYHHFECAAYLYGVPCLSDIKSDFNKCISDSKQITRKSIKSEKLVYKVLGRLLKVIAPLM